MLGDVEFQHGDTTTHHQISLTAQTLRLREDFTGFLLDQQTAIQQPHDQRGDLIDLESDALTAQAQGWMKRRGPIAALDQELEVGDVARLDVTSGQQYRLAVDAMPTSPYHKDTDLGAVLGDVGLYAAADLRLAPWAVVRGGVRTDVFTYNVIDHCASHDLAHPVATNPPGDASCLAQADFGTYRAPVQRSSTAAAVVYRGAPVDDLDLELRLSGFRTHGDQDQIFSETAGRNVLAGGSTRLGGALSGRVRGPWIDHGASVTVVRSTFDATGLLIPYVPDVVVRSAVSPRRLREIRSTQADELALIAVRCIM